MAQGFRERDPEGSSSGGNGARSAARRGGWFTRLLELKPVRVARHFAKSGGSLMAAGLSFHAVFAVFAALWLGFAVGGLLLDAEPALRNEVLRFINQAAPGLIATDSTEGAIRAKSLLEVQVLGWTGAVALVGLAFTMVRWLVATRTAIRALFSHRGPRVNPLALALRYLGLALGIGVAVLVSAGVTLLGTRSLGLLRPFVSSSITEIGAWLVGLLVGFAFDAALLLALFRVLAGINLPLKRLTGGALLGAGALALLKVTGSQLIVGASSNPLLASFAAIVGLMVWFYLVSQIILLAASWVAVDASSRAN